MRLCEFLANKTKRTQNTNLFLILRCRYRNSFPVVVRRLTNILALSYPSIRSTQPMNTFCCTVYKMSICQPTRVMQRNFGAYVKSIKAMHKSNGSWRMIRRRRRQRHEWPATIIHCTPIRLWMPSMSCMSKVIRPYGPKVCTMRNAIVYRKYATHAIRP